MWRAPAAVSAVALAGVAIPAAALAALAAVVIPGAASAVVLAVAVIPAVFPDTEEAAATSSDGLSKSCRIEDFRRGNTRKMTENAT